MEIPYLEEKQTNFTPLFNENLWINFLHRKTVDWGKHKSYILSNMLHLKYKISFWWEENFYLQKKAKPTPLSKPTKNPTWIKISD